MKKYISKSNKTKEIQDLINTSLYILESVGIPLQNKTERSLERMAMSFLAVAGLKSKWPKEIEFRNDSLKTRDIITFINTNFDENISSGSYDDIRRKDLKLLVLADIVENKSAKLESATNDPTRGYTLNSEFKDLLLKFNTKEWDKQLSKYLKKRKKLSEQLQRNRDLKKIPVELPNGKLLQLSFGDHNVLQKAIIEEFLPRFGSDCVVLYIGDTSKKILHIEENELKNLNFFELSHNEMPDIVAYSKENNWLYLIEAVHSSGPMSEIRLIELKKLLYKCKAELIFVTGFLTRNDFRKWTMDIAWETEVWIAENPDHLIHFNGHKFLGAYKSENKE